jgi:hypothetical protein
MRIMRDRRRACRRKDFLNEESMTCEAEHFRKLLILRSPKSISDRLRRFISFSIRTLEVPDEIIRKSRGKRACFGQGQANASVSPPLSIDSFLRKALFLTLPIRSSRGALPYNSRPSPSGLLLRISVKQKCLSLKSCIIKSR